MKYFIILFLLSPISLFGQSKAILVRGTFDEVQENRFAYLHIQKIDDRPEELIVIPIINKQFIFEKIIDTKGRLSTGVIIFLAKENNISIDKYHEMESNNPDFFINDEIFFILEDSVHIEFKFPLRQSIVKGGNLNNEYRLFQNAIKEKKLVTFIAQHPDCSFSITGLKAIDFAKKYTREFDDVDIVELFNNLTDRIKQSIEGKAFAEKYLK